MTNSYSATYGEWLAAEFVKAKAESKSGEFNVRKPACDRVDKLLAAMAMLDEYLSLDESDREKAVNDSFGGG